VTSWSGSGKATAVVTRLLEAATRQNRLDELGKEVEQALARNPEWRGGKALLTVIRGRQGRYDEARSNLEALLAVKSKTIPAEARVVLGQELEDLAPLRPLALALYEGSVKDNSLETRLRGLGFQLGPARRLVELYNSEGRNREARDLIMAHVGRLSENVPGYDAEYAAYRRVEDLPAMGGQMLTLGYPILAVQICDRLLASTEDFQAAQRFMGNTDYITRQAQDGMTRALQGLNPRTLGPTLETLLKPDHQARTRRRPSSWCSSSSPGSSTARR
jgi:hypothetical protein